MDRLINTIIQTIDQRSRRLHDQNALKPELGLVTDMDPLTVRLTMTGIEIEDPMILTQYDYDPFLGDDVVVIPLVDGRVYVDQVKVGLRDEPPPEDQDQYDDDPTQNLGL